MVGRRHTRFATYALASSVALWAAACSPDLPSGEIACGDGSLCPKGMTCWSDQVCRAGAEIDGAAPAVTSIRLEAETFDDNLALDATYQWVEESIIPDASGTYMSANPDLGEFCDVSATMPPADCGAELRYEVQMQSAGSYHVFLRGVAEDNGEDSVYLGLDGDLLSTVDFPENLAFWNWVEAPSTVSLEAAATHTLHIWMREDGAHLDSIVVSESSTPPE